MEPVKHFKNIIKKLAEAEVCELAFFGGEPFLYPYILELGSYSRREFGLYTGFLSNGFPINDAEIKKIPSSFDAGSFALHGFKTTHDEIVGVSGAHQKVIKVIQSLIKEGFPVGINITVSKKNLKEMEKFIPFVMELGVDVTNINVMIPFLKDQIKEKLSLSEFHWLLTFFKK